MLKTGPLTPRMVRRITVADKKIRIIWGPRDDAYIPAEDLGAMVGVDVDRILAYADCPVMQFEWLRFRLLNLPEGVVCVRLAAVPCLLTALALQTREEDPHNLLLEWVAQDTIDTLADRWHLGDPKVLRNDRLQSWLQVADAFSSYQGDLDAADDDAPPSNE